MRTRWIVAGLLVSGLGGAALADTGGSMGGGDWSGGGGGGGGGYSSGGGGYSSGGGSYSFSSGGSSGTGDLGVDVAMLVAFVIFSLVVGAIKAATARNEAMTYTGDDSSTPGGGDVDVSVLRIAVDGRARKFVQSELARIAKLADTKTSEGRATMLREVALMLRRLRDAWVYGGAVNEPMRELGTQKSIFDHWVDDARARFREETVRNEQGQTTATAPSSYTPRSDEGAGLILVSIIVAARRELFTVTNIGNGDDLRAALESTAHLAAENLIAIELVWQPSEDADRLSSMELEAKFPRPDLIPIQNALVGKVFCSYCGGPFPGELVTCPHCGAPAPGHERDAPPAKAA